MCDLSFWVFCIELILATVSPMEHKRDATVGWLGGSPNVVILNITSTVFLAIGSGPYTHCGLLAPSL